MKIFKLMIAALTIMGFSQNALANNPQKIALVKKVYETFDAESSQEWMNYLGTSSLKNSLKKSNDYEKWYDKKYGADWNSCADPVDPYPGNGGIERGPNLSLKYTEADNGLVIVQLRMDDELNNYHEKDFMAYKVILENGQYKIDDFGSAGYDKAKSKWKLGASFKQYNNIYCKIGIVN